MEQWYEKSRVKCLYMELSIGKHKKIIIAIVGAILLLMVGFGMGWYVRNRFFPHVVEPESLRLSGFQFAKPLLVCDTAKEKTYLELRPIVASVSSFIADEEKTGNVSTVSVYVQDLKTDGRIDINPDMTFRAASLGKVAVMIAYYRLAESNHSILSEKIYDGVNNLNDKQEIQPQMFAHKGQTYSVNELIKLMIQYSDDNALYLLLNFVKPSTLESLYQDVQIPFPINSENPNDFETVTTRNMSYFFRILYNSTYLTNDLSEEALLTLSNIDYKSGISVGLPSTIPIAHKFGLETFRSDGEVISRQLHDCGIVYHSINPYVICIMTKSSSTIDHIQHTIQGISSIVYQGINAYAQKLK